MAHLCVFEVLNLDSPITGTKRSAFRPGILYVQLISQTTCSNLFIAFESEGVCLPWRNDRRY